MDDMPHDTQPLPRKARAAAELLAEMRRLRERVSTEADQLLAEWDNKIPRAEFRESARNLAEYIVLRRNDLRALQEALTGFGLSSLGRLEGRVMANLDAVIAALSAIAGEAERPAFPDSAAMFHGQALLESHADRLFGPLSAARRVRLMVTLPSRRRR